MVYFMGLRNHRWLWDWSCKSTCMRAGVFLHLGLALITNSREWGTTVMQLGMWIPVKANWFCCRYLMSLRLKVPADSSASLIEWTRLPFHLEVRYTLNVVCTVEFRDSFRPPSGTMLGKGSALAGKVRGCLGFRCGHTLKVSFTSCDFIHGVECYSLGNKNIFTK